MNPDAPAGISLETIQKAVIELKPSRAKRAVLYTLQQQEVFGTPAYVERRDSLGNVFRIPVERVTRCGVDPLDSTTAWREEYYLAIEPALRELLEVPLARDLRERVETLEEARRVLKRDLVNERAKAAAFWKLPWWKRVVRALRGLKR